MDTHASGLRGDRSQRADGAFLSRLKPDLEAVTELFRRLLLAALRRAGRLSESFHERLLGWSPSGVSVNGPPVAHADGPDQLEDRARGGARVPRRGSGTAPI